VGTIYPLASAAVSPATAVTPKSPRPGAVLDAVTTSENQAPEPQSACRATRDESNGLVRSVAGAT
jgi:hypothetical protein